MFRFIFSLQLGGYYTVNLEFTNLAVVRTMKPKTILKVSWTERTGSLSQNKLLTMRYDLLLPDLIDKFAHWWKKNRGPRPTALYPNPRYNKACYNEGKTKLMTVLFALQ